MVKASTGDDPAFVATDYEYLDQAIQLKVVRGE
jgi:hypothetical protein